MPSVIEEHALNMPFMDKHVRVFQSAPPNQNKDYLAWLEKVQTQRKKKWKELGIYDMIKISRTGPRYNPDMLLASIFFWDGSTITFQFPCGMLTPTLLDVAAITRLNPQGENFTPTLEETN